MILQVVLVIALCATGCTITIAPIPQSPRNKSKSKQISHAKPKPKPTPAPRVADSSTIVDHEWLIEYKRLEEEHGDYTLMDDQKVEAVGDGKYKVTPAMLEHFRDLSQVPPK